MLLRNNLVLSYGIEPSSTGYQPIALPLSYKRKFGGPKGIRTPVDGVTSRYINQTILWDLNLVEITGIEPVVP